MAANPITDLKNRYAGRKTTLDRITDNTLKAMERAYLDAYNDVYAKVVTARENDKYATYARQAALLKKISKELDMFASKSGKVFERALKDLAQFSSKNGYRDCRLLKKKCDKNLAWHKKYNTDYVETVFKDNFRHIAAQTDKMKQSVKTMIQKEAMMIIRRASVSGLTRKQAHKELLSEIISKKPEFSFIDKRGRRWETRNYFDMLTRTVMHNTMRETYINTITKEGVDLVKVSRNGATDPCRFWEGRILSVTGQTDGYPTVTEATATGEVFHPRCKHRLIAYHPDVEEFFKKKDEEFKDAA